MDIYIPDKNVIEIKYLKSAGGRLTAERGRFYADLCKLALFCENDWKTFLFLVLDRKMETHFKSQSIRGEFGKS
jgi:prophage maintenance system killer protein